MEVSRKRSKSQTSNAKPAKRNKLSSELDGGYWKRPATRRKVALGNRFQQETREKEPSSETSLIVRPTFNTGLPVVFGQRHIVTEEEELEQPFAALRRLGTVLNKNTVLQADEVEEPESPPRSPVYQQPLRVIDSAPAPVSSTNTWNFVPSWEAICVGARILKQALVFPLSVARYLVDVAPETRRQARLIEAARREQDQLVLDQWLAERSQPRVSPDSDLSSPPLSPFLSPSPSPPSPPPADPTMSASAGGATPGGNPPPPPPPDGNAALLGQIQQLIQTNMDALRLELNRAPNDPNARRLALRTERGNLAAKIAAVDAEDGLIEAGQWNGPTTPLGPTSIYVAPAPVSVSTGGGPAKPRFNPVDLPPILFGQDLEEWISHMDHMVSSFGELIVCPHILHRCFTVGDPMRDWYLTKPSEVHTFVTTGTGCWDRFKTLLRGRFKPDVGVMQYEADSYRKLPGDSWAAFGIRKYRLLKRAYEGAEEANIILKIKAAMDTDVVRYCKEKTNIDTFVGELMDYDRTSPATTYLLRGLQEAAVSLSLLQVRVYGRFAVANKSD
jgi:hypothetical protein